jgi:cytidine deaminase
VTDRGDTPATPGVDWPALRAAATEAAAHAYAPYSRYRVGAAALVDDGRVVSGCNVENASYGLTLCAECGLVSDLHRSGGGRLVAVTCAAGPLDGALGIGSPCGRCRQLLFEAGGPGLLVDTIDGVVSMDQLLPGAFGPDALP